MSDSGEPVIFTVGHGTRSTDGFMALLREADIVRLVDVRSAPGSRRNPQFGQDALAGSLGMAGIEYVWRKDLGGFRRPRPDSRHTALRNPSFRGYADYMETGGFRAALRWLIETSEVTRTAVMCAESLWWRCHRRMIADALVAAGHDVAHLTDRGLAAHMLHPAARIVAGRPVYDVGTQQELEV